MEKTPKQVAISEVLKRIVTKDQAKDDFKKWINNSLKNPFPTDVIKFWEEVLIEVDKIE